MAINSDKNSVDKVPVALTKMPMDANGQIMIMGFPKEVQDNTTDRELKGFVYEVHKSIVSNYMKAGIFINPDSEEYYNDFIAIITQSDLKLSDEGGLVSGYSTAYVNPLSVISTPVEGFTYRKNRNKVTPLTEKLLEELLVESHTLKESKAVTKAGFVYTDGSGASKKVAVDIQVGVGFFIEEFFKATTESHMDNKFLLAEKLYLELIRSIVFEKENTLIDYAWVKAWFKVTRDKYRNQIKEEYNKLYSRYDMTVEKVLPLSRTVSFKSYNEPKEIQVAVSNYDSAFQEVKDLIFMVKLLEAL